MPLIQRQIQFKLPQAKAFLAWGSLFLMMLFQGAHPLPAMARSAATPWTNEMSFQNLAYGSSTPHDVQLVMGAPPDEIVRMEQMFPVVENHLYYDEGGSGAATVFVFQNNLLMGMHYKSPTNQYVDLTYFLPNNGDRQVNTPLQGGYYSYYPYFPFYSW